MTKEEMGAMSFDEKLAKLRQGIVIPPPEREYRELDLQKVAMIALGFGSRGDFAMCDKTAYNWAGRHGFMDMVCGHMEAVKRGPKS